MRVTAARTLISLLLTSCTTSATFTFRTERPLEATIVGGDNNLLLVRTESGYEQTVERGEVVDIDHPGNVVALVGAILTGSGVAGMVVTISTCANSFASSSCAVNAVTQGGTLGAGAAMLTWGLWAWLSSRNLVTSTLSPGAPPPPPGPVSATGPAWLPSASR